jgi:hypothetical protein
MPDSTRRDFIKAGVAAAGLPAFAAPTKRQATDFVTLGKSNVKVTGLAFGTGTSSGRVQRDLGQAEFTRLVRHAYDRGIQLFESSETYHGMAEMLAIALKGLPRDSYRLMTKYARRPPAIRRRRSTGSGRSLAPNISIFCCCTAFVRPPGPVIIRICRTQCRRRRARKSSCARARRFTGSRRCARSGKRVSRHRDDPHEPQRFAHGYLGAEGRVRSRRRGRGRRAHQEGSRAGHGCN